MKRYKLKVLTGGGFTLDFEVVADYFQTQTNNSLINHIPPPNYPYLLNGYPFGFCNYNLFIF